MTAVHGFQLQRERGIKELNTHAGVYRHDKTGAEVLSLTNDDENKVFGVEQCAARERNSEGDEDGLPFRCCR